MRRPEVLLVGTTVLAIVLAPSEAAAQISPGVLSRAHSTLEGSGQCLSCHHQKSTVDQTRCLGCHTPLRQRVREGLGLHAGADYTACERCHIEHQGLDFELVWWGDDGTEAFDHQLTGYDLIGAHRALACRDCHQSSNVAEPAPLLAADKDLDRTFLGLSESCQTCHVDPHLGQFADRTCDSCHETTTFERAHGFDHATARFPLTGLHQQVECQRCHPAAPGSETVADDAGRRAQRQFRDLEFSSCQSCHDDPHQGRLGARCASCHSTTGWRTLTSGFDHSKTAYDLVGKHRSVGCQDCHGADLRNARPASESCSDCHRDPHLAQFGDTGCESCHDEQGFEATRFTREDHGTTDFGLHGAHFEVACESCHVEAETRALAADLGVPTTTLADLPGTTRRFHWSDLSCESCHQDPHLGSASFEGQLRCDGCHDTSSWWSVAFSHRTTGYDLGAGHRGLECRSCHPQSSSEVSTAAIDFSQASNRCASCHADPHRGQFSSTPPTRSQTASTDTGSCERCHASARFVPSIFDHQLDSRFPLEGAHQNVACEKCHIPEATGSTLTSRGSSEESHRFVRYRPLGRECSDCHGDQPVSFEGTRSVGGANR